MRLLLEQWRAHCAALAGVFVLATVNQLLLLAEPHVLRLMIDASRCIRPGCADS